MVSLAAMSQTICAVKRWLAVLLARLLLAALRLQLPACRVRLAGLLLRTAVAVAASLSKRHVALLVAAWLAIRAGKLKLALLMPLLVLLVRLLHAACMVLCPPSLAGTTAKAATMPTQQFLAAALSRLSLASRALHLLRKHGRR